MRLVLLDHDRATADAHLKAFRSVRPDWTVALADTSDAAVAALYAAPTDVLIADLGTPATEAVALLEAVRDRWPSTVRIALSDFRDRAAMLRLERTVHRFVRKPCDTYMLAMMIERSMTLRTAIDDPAVLAAVGGLEAIPRPPVTVMALEKVLADPDAGVVAVASVVTRDAALTARLLRVVNSSFFGVGRQVTRVDAAVNFVGVSLVRAIALADGATRAFTVSPNVLDLDEWNAHAVRVATAARDIALAVHPQDRSLADEAFLAGLLHDIGQVVLAGVSPEAWCGLEAQARLETASVDAIEVASSAVSHAAIGAYLLSLWGLPGNVIEAVAFHHAPDRLSGTLFDPAIAVHVADALVPRPAGRAAPALMHERVLAAGVTDEQLAAWRSRYGALEPVA